MMEERKTYLRDVAEDALSWVEHAENVLYRVEEAGMPDPDGVRGLAKAIPELLDELDVMQPAITRLYWFYRMVAIGGPDGSDLDEAVCQDAEQAAQWYGPRLEAEAGLVAP